MQYNFDQVLSRRDTNSVKWDLNKDTDLLPMWVADMDFTTAPVIVEALQQRLSQAAFGYTLVPSEFYEAIQQWWIKRHECQLEKGWIVPVTGVIPGLVAIISAFTNPGDKIILQSPVYSHFYTTISDCNRQVSENNLIYSNGNYSIDFEDLELRASDPQAKLLILCNPHNPTGRAFTKEELTKIGEICLRHNVLVVSDEIHSDLVFKEHKHIPFASIGEELSNNSITLASPSKTFNLAGLQVAYFFASDKTKRKKVEKTLATQGATILSPFAITSLIAAYNEAEEWLEHLKEYLYSSYIYLREFFAQHLPDIHVVTLEATYLVWIDCKILGKDSATLTKQLLEQEKLWLNAGSMYGAAGNDFLRINIGCPRELLIDGLNRLKHFIENQSITK